MATPNYAAGCVAGEATISRAQHHISASRGWHLNVANHSRHSRGTTGALPPVAEGSFSPARILFACLERVRYACREEPATPIMRSLQGIVRVLHAGYCHASGQPLRRALPFHQRFHRHRAHKRCGHQCGACTILLEIRADERCAGLIGTPWAHVQLQSERANYSIGVLNQLRRAPLGETRATPQRAVLRLTLFEQRVDEKLYRLPFFRVEFPARRSQYMRSDASCVARDDVVRAHLLAGACRRRASRALSAP
jgi:hypothetical protein